MKATLHRRDVVEILLSNRKDLLVVAGLGSTAWDITAAGDSPLNSIPCLLLPEAGRYDTGVRWARIRRSLWTTP